MNITVRTTLHLSTLERKVVYPGTCGLSPTGSSASVITQASGEWSLISDLTAKNLDPFIEWQFHSRTLFSCEPHVVASLLLAGVVKALVASEL